MVESPLNKKKLALTIFWFFLFVNDLNAQYHILNWKVLSNKELNCSSITSINLFIDDSNNTVVLVKVSRKYSTEDFLFINNNWISVDKYGRLLNGFIKDGHFHLAFAKDGNIVIYSVGKDIKFASPMKMEDLSGGMSAWPKRIIPVPRQKSSYYCLGQRRVPPVHPIEFLVGFLSGGHGIMYTKPCLSEIRVDRISKYRKIRYGGKRDESYFVKEVATGKDSIHFLGFRTPEERNSGAPKLARNRLVTLHYADYNFKKKKTTKKHSIYEDIPKYDKNTDTNSYYGPLSIDNVDDDIFVVFSWVEKQCWREELKKREGFNIKDFKSDIYYCQSSNSSFGDVEKIANGFLPLVRVDFLGNVHVVWLSSDGGLVHKVKKKGGWCEEKIILNNVDIYRDITFSIYPDITYRKISAEFDKDNNLNLIFPADGNLVHAKVKLSFLLNE
jgi:hypothetical protein